MQNLDDTSRRNSAEEQASLTNAGGETTSETAQPNSLPEKRSFASVLDSLRTIEDTFYFSIESGSQMGLRIPLEGHTVELPLGFDSSKRNICFNPESIAVLCAILRKDWSGVQIIPQDKGSIRINGEVVTSARRLRHGDRLELCKRSRKNSGLMDSVLVFHEPVSLRVLPSLLPHKHPPSEAVSESNGGPLEGKAQSSEPAPKASPNRRGPRKLYFGLFSTGQLGLMFVFTLIGAAAVFFILNWLQKYMR
jgi:hypothetical protein